MRQSAAVLCHDKSSLQTLTTTLEELGIEQTNCRSQQEALELVTTGRCSILLVDFDLPGAVEVIRMANLLPPAQKPALIAVARRAWPGTGQAFQSGASRILYRPLEADVVKDAIKAGRKSVKTNRRQSARYEAKTLIYLELETGTVSAMSIDIGEHGLALQSAEPVPMSSNVEFHCALPGTDVTLHGHADVIWASDQGRAGLFFSKLSSTARKNLNHWLRKRGNHSKDKHAVCDLLPPAEDHVSFASSQEEVLTEAE